MAQPIPPPHPGFIVPQCDNGEGPCIKAEPLFCSGQVCERIRLAVGEMPSGHEMRMERYTESCSSCRGHSKCRIVCSCGWSDSLHEINIGYDLDYRIKRLEHLEGLI